MNVTKAISASMVLFLGAWAGTASAYDTTLYRNVAQLQKAAKTLSTNLTYRTHRYYNKNVVNDSRNLARAARTLKMAVRNKLTQTQVQRRFEKLSYRFNHLMGNLGYRNYSYNGYSARNIGYDVHNVQRSFDLVSRTFTGYRYGRRYRYPGHRYPGHRYPGYRYNDYRYGYPNRRYRYNGYGYGGYPYDYRYNRNQNPKYKSKTKNEKIR